MNLDQLMSEVVARNASDGFITARAAPSVKVDGEIFSLEAPALDEDVVRGLVLGSMTDAQQSQFLRSRECNYAIQHPEHGRFRASAFVQRGNFGLVIRRIQSRIPKIDELGLPSIIEELAMTQRGLVIFVGGTGTGKSTSLAAMVGHRNQHSRGHILSVEDPIEFVHDHIGCLVTQREVGLDTESFESGLQNALRQAPDVILIGEVRNAETMGLALSFAETGHLCLCTLHANNADQALDRIMSFFPASMHNQVWMDLSLNLKAMVAQQLLPRKSGSGRVPVMEVVLNSALIADHIRHGRVNEVKGVVANSNERGMQTIDQSLIAAYKEGAISREDAVRFADSTNDVRLAIKLFDKSQGRGGTVSRVDLTVDDG